MDDTAGLHSAARRYGHTHRLQRQIRQGRSHRVEQTSRIRLIRCCSRKGLASNRRERIHCQRRGCDRVQDLSKKNPAALAAGIEIADSDTAYSLFHGLGCSGGASFSTRNSPCLAKTHRLSPTRTVGNSSVSICKRRARPSGAFSVLLPSLIIIALTASSTPTRMCLPTSARTADSSAFC